MVLITCKRVLITPTLYIGGDVHGQFRDKPGVALKNYARLVGSPNDYYLLLCHGLGSPSWDRKDRPYRTLLASVFPQIHMTVYKPVCWRLLDLLLERNLWFSTSSTN